MKVRFPYGLTPCWADEGCMKHLTARPNAPHLAGSSASNKETFGEFSRYAVMAVHTRFEAVQWFVFDAETTDELTGLPAVIRQEDTLESAVAGLL